MEKSAYHTTAWRELPRDGPCVVGYLFGEAAGPCSGLIHRHHVVPRPEARSIQVCAAHHPKLEAALRLLLDPARQWRRCPHKPGTHRYRFGLEACERRLNRRLLELVEAA